MFLMRIILAVQALNWLVLSSLALFYLERLIFQLEAVRTEIIDGNIKHAVHLYNFDSHVFDVLLSKSNFFGCAFCLVYCVDFPLRSPFLI